MNTEKSMDSRAIMDAAIAAGIDNDNLGRLARHLYTSPAEAPAVARVPGEGVVVGAAPAPVAVAKKTVREREVSDAARYVDEHLAPYLRRTSDGRTTGTTHEMLAMVPWPFGATTPSAGRSLGSKLGTMAKKHEVTPGGVYVVRKHDTSPHGEKNAARYTLGVKGAR